MQEQVVQNGVNTKTYFVIVWLLFTAVVVPFNMYMRILSVLQFSQEKKFIKQNLP